MLPSIFNQCHICYKHSYFFQNYLKMMSFKSGSNFTLIFVWVLVTVKVAVITSSSRKADWQVTKWSLPERWQFKSEGCYLNSPRYKPANSQNFLTVPFVTLIEFLPNCCFHTIWTYSRWWKKHGFNSREEEAKEKVFQPIEWVLEKSVFFE